MGIELPDVVLRADAIGERLGRPAHSRKALNRDEWYVYDPVLSFVQRGMRKGQTGYRVGYKIDSVSREVSFVLEHSPIIARLFKHNLVLSSMIAVVRSTEEFRRTHWVYRSSRQAVRLGFKSHGIAGSSLAEFVSQLEEFDARYGFVKDMFPKRPNTGKGGGTAPVAGNTFYLALADRPELFDSQHGVRLLVERSWPLFLCLYPVEPIEGRSASLARNMRVRGIPAVCEFGSIVFPESNSISPLCRGAIQGAHIKPDALGGSDRPENGVWLCEYHHRATEGKLAGRRSDSGLDVSFVGPGKA
jgi:hypothetical protein